MSDELPESWELATLERIATLHQGFGFPKHLQGRTVGDLGFYKVSDISRAVAAGSECLSHAAHYISRDEAKRLRATPLPKGAVVFARIGEAIKLNRRAVLPKDALVDNNVIGAKASADIDDRYLLFFLKTVRLGELSQATTVPAVRTSDIAEIEVPVAPTNEQRRIVSKIDELFSRIDEGERALERVSKLVERYRQSVLKAAVTGELTRDWREQRKAAGQPIESGEALLTRILTARREAWEQAELAKMRTKGITPKDDAWKKKYREPAPPETAGLPELPDGWLWTSMGALTRGFITGPFGSALHKSDYVEGGTPLINPINLRGGVITPDTSVSVSMETLERLQRYKLCMGDIVLARRGEMGRCAPVTSKEEGWMCGTGSAMLRCTNAVLPAYAALAISSGHSKKFLEDNCAGTTMHNLNQDAMSRMPVPIPSQREQETALDICSFKLVGADYLLQSVLAERRHAEALRQAILRSAFSGKLTHQDESEESAFSLLERIAAERPESNSAAPRRGRKKKSS